LKGLEKNARDIRKRLQRFAEEAEIQLAIQSAMGSGTPEPKEEFERREAAARLRPPLLSSNKRRSAVGDLLEAERALKAHRKDIPKANDEAFCPSFVEEIVYCWVRLTVKPPSRRKAEPFTAFVAAAHATLWTKGRSHLNLPFHIPNWNPDEERNRKRDAEWGSQVDKTLKRISHRPRYDRADRYEWHAASGLRPAPPTVGIQPSSVRREFGAGDSDDFDRETRRLNKLMLEGSVEAAQILWCEYQLGGRELQQHFELDRKIRRAAKALELARLRGKSTAAEEERLKAAGANDCSVDLAKAQALIWPEGRYIIIPPSSSP
jgi:hypothetical protein